MKRAREEEPQALPFAQFSELVLRREDLARWCNSPFLPKLVPGFFAKATLPGAPRPSLLHIVGLGEPLGEPAPIEFAGDASVLVQAGSGGGGGGGALRVPGTPAPPAQAQGGRLATRCARCLRLYDHAARSFHTVPIASISNSAVGAEEWEALARAVEARGGGGAGPALPTPAEHSRLVEEWARITRAHLAGKFCTVRGGEGSGEQGSAAGTRAWGAAPLASSLAPALASAAAAAAASAPSAAASAAASASTSAGASAATPAAPAAVRLAVIVPYRDTDPRQGRAAQLARFCAHMPRFLASAEVQPPLASFTILIVEQSSDGYKFNRGKLLNIGFALLHSRSGRESLRGAALEDAASAEPPPPAPLLSPADIEQGFTAFCLHDVDLLPSAPLGPWYAAQPHPLPIHIGAAWGACYDYTSYLGGILTLSAPTMLACNGYPNDYWGWGGEDDEIQRRLMRTGGFPALQPSSAISALPGVITDLEKGGELRAGVSLKDGGERNWRNMLKKEALELGGERWQGNGVGQCEYALVGARRVGGGVIVATVDVLGVRDATAQRMFLGSGGGGGGKDAAAEAEEERLRALLVAPCGAGGKGASDAAAAAAAPGAAVPRVSWREGIPKPFLNYVGIQGGRAAGETAYLALLSPPCRALRKALCDASLEIGAWDCLPRGAGSVSHRVWVIPRSWLTQDLAVEAEERSAGGAGSAGSSSGSGTLVMADEGMPDMLTKALSNGPPFDAFGRGQGPMGVRERVVGSFHYLLQQRRVLPGGTCMLAPMACVADAGYDEGCPDITAWRAVRKYIDEGIGLSLCRAAIVAQIDVSDAAVAAGARRALPPLQAAPHASSQAHCRFLCWTWM